MLQPIWKVGWWPSYLHQGVLRLGSACWCSTTNASQSLLLVNTMVSYIKAHHVTSGEWLGHVLKCDVIYKPCQLYVCLVYKPCKLYYKDVLHILQYYKYYKPCKLDYKDVLILRACSSSDLSGTTVPKYFCSQFLYVVFICPTQTAAFTLISMAKSTWKYDKS